MLKSFRDLDKVKIISVCDTNKNRLRYVKNLYPEIKIFQSFDKTVADKDVDAFCIATPASTHFKIAKDSLISNRHVLVEKPMALSYREAETLVKMAKFKKKVLMVGHTLEYSASVNKLKEMIALEKLGKILYIDTARTNWGIFRKDINVIWDLCPHDISVLNYILASNPVAVSAIAKANLNKKIVDTAFIVLKYPGNIIVNSRVSWVEPFKGRKVLIVGSKKTAVYDDLNIKEPIKIYHRNIQEKPLLLKLSSEKPLDVECRHFLDCILRGRNPRSGGKSGLAVIRVLEAIQKSSDAGGKVISLLQRT